MSEVPEADKTGATVGGQPATGAKPEPAKPADTKAGTKGKPSFKEVEFPDGFKLSKKEGENSRLTAPDGTTATWEKGSADGTFKDYWADAVSGLKMPEEWSQGHEPLSGW